MSSCFLDVPRRRPFFRRKRVQRYDLFPNYQNFFCIIFSWDSRPCCHSACWERKKFSKSPGFRRFPARISLFVPPFLPKLGMFRSTFCTIFTHFIVYLQFTLFLAHFYIYFYYICLNSAIHLYDIRPFT